MRVQEIADKLELRLLAPSTAQVSGIASFATARDSDLVFVAEARLLEAALASRAGAIIAGEFASEAAARANKAVLIATNPKLAFALAAALLERAAERPAGVHPTAVVHPTAKVAASASVDAYVVVGQDSVIGMGTHVGPGCVIANDVTIGADCDLVARVTIYANTAIGDRTVVHAGVVLGDDGFGFVPDPKTGRYHKFPQIGRLEIGNDVEIGANATIDRGALDATVISDGVKLDNMVHIAHNAFLGRNVVIAAQCAVSGSAWVGDNVLMGGQVGIGDHVRIEEGAIMGAQCGVPTNKTIRGKGVVFWGTPARPIKEYLKELAMLSRLAKKKGSGS